jgi:hypothetical protein
MKQFYFQLNVTQAHAVNTLQKFDFPPDKVLVVDSLPPEPVASCKGCVKFCKGDWLLTNEGMRGLPVDWLTGIAKMVCVAKPDDKLYNKS